MELHLNFSLTQEELHDPRLYHEGFGEVVRIDTGAVRAIVPDASVTVARGSIGKGASNWGVDVILVLTTLANMDALIDLGARLVNLVKSLAGGGPERGLVTRDETTAGVLAVGLYQPTSDLAGSEILGSWCVSGGNPGIGFDGRDVWVTYVSRPDQSLVVIVTSAGGALLGSLIVPPGSKRPYRVPRRLRRYVRRLP